MWLAELQAPAVALGASHSHGPGWAQQPHAGQAGQLMAETLLLWARGTAMDQLPAAAPPTVHSSQPS